MTDLRNKSVQLTTAVILFLLPLLFSALAAAEDNPTVDVLRPEQRQQMEASIDRALSWLASEQKNDGSFPTLKQGQPGVTSICLLAFLSRGHMPGEGPYGETIERGLDFVRSCQKRGGILSYVSPPAVQMHNAGHTAMYNHAIAGLLLAETYGMTGGEGSGELRDTIEQALAFTLNRQQHPRMNPPDDGGWRYYTYWPNVDSDLSVTSWQLLFLRSARNAGFEVPSGPIDDAVAYVKRCYDPAKGTFLYGLIGDDRRDTRAMAGAGILALSLGGLHETPMAQNAGDWLLKNNFSRYLSHGRNYYDSRYFYGAFYGCQAMFQLGGRHWSEFYPQVVNALVNNQDNSGSWLAEPGEDNHYGNDYTTGMAVLALTTPYQLLPIFQR